MTRSGVLPIARAANFDRALRRRSPTIERVVEAKRILPARYDRTALLDALAAGKIALYRGVPTGPVRVPSVEELCLRIRHSLGDRERANVQVGPSRRRATMSVSDLMRRWLDDRYLTSTTDLHFRGTPLVQRFRVDSISDFNLLGPPSPDWLEMLTLVVSTAGAVSESHSDDCDGSNHCVVGAKLWFVWDRLEGASVGLHDVTYDQVYGAERFDLGLFSGLRSSRWFIVTPGVTLFLPGHLTHRVITLERYLGFGSFNITLASWPRTLGRWQTTGASYIDDTMRRHLVSRVQRRALRVRTHASARRAFGWERARQAIRKAERLLPARVRNGADFRSFAALFG